MKFIKSTAGHVVVEGYKGALLGTIEPNGIIFQGKPVFLDKNLECEYTSNCLRKIADKIDSAFEKDEE